MISIKSAYKLAVTRDAMVGQDASTYGSVGENKAEFDWAQNMIASSPR